QCRRTRPPDKSSRPARLMASRQFVAPHSGPRRETRTAWPLEGSVRVRDGRGNRSLLQQDVVDGQYVAQLFKWVKQHLRIKAFFGTSENAVKTQIWIAIWIYVLVAIVRKRLGLEASLCQILQILSVTLFEKTPILLAFQTLDSQDDSADSGNQLNLFDF